jgi:hypothetical protein
MNMGLCRKKNGEGQGGMRTETEMTERGSLLWRRHTGRPHQREGNAGRKLVFDQ